MKNMPNMIDTDRNVTAFSIFKSIYSFDASRKEELHSFLEDFIKNLQKLVKTLQHLDKNFNNNFNKNFLNFLNAHLKSFIKAGKEKNSNFAFEFNTKTVDLVLAYYDSNFKSDPIVDNYLKALMAATNSSIDNIKTEEDYLKEKNPFESNQKEFSENNQTNSTNSKKSLPRKKTVTHASHTAVDNIQNSQKAGSTNGILASLSSPRHVNDISSSVPNISKDSDSKIRRQRAHLLKEQYVKLPSNPAVPEEENVFFEFLANPEHAQRYSANRLQELKTAGHRINPEFEEKCHAYARYCSVYNNKETPHWTHRVDPSILEPKKPVSKPANPATLQSEQSSVEKPLKTTRGQLTADYIGDLQKEKLSLEKQLPQLEKAKKNAQNDLDTFTNKYRGLLGRIKRLWDKTTYKTQKSQLEAKYKAENTKLSDHTREIVKIRKKIYNESNLLNREFKTEVAIPLLKAEPVKPVTNKKEATFLSPTYFKRMFFGLPNENKTAKQQDSANHDSLNQKGESSSLSLFGKAS